MAWFTYQGIVVMLPSECRNTAMLDMGQFRNYFWKLYPNLASILCRFVFWNLKRVRSSEKTGANWSTNGSLLNLLYFTMNLNCFVPALFTSKKYSIALNRNRNLATIHPPLFQYKRILRNGAGKLNQKMKVNVRRRNSLFPFDCNASQVFSCIVTIASYIYVYQRWQKCFSDISNKILQKSEFKMKIFIFYSNQVFVEFILPSLFFFFYFRCRNFTSNEILLY